jgi:hypothetical protein
MNKAIKHYEESVLIAASAEEVFAYADDHNNFSSHMNKSSWMMGGGKMETKIDEGKGQKAGSHIRMSGKVFGINLFLDEVVTQHESPFRKEWQTVGEVNLVVIDQYTLGFSIKSEKNNSRLKVFIDYELPKSLKTHWLGVIFGEMYAKWCVRQMVNGVKEHFINNSYGN